MNEPTQAKPAADAAGARVDRAVGRLVEKTMRPMTRKKIDALHAQIAELVESEKRYHDAKNPGQNRLRRSISHAQIEIVLHSPQHRANMVEATASLPSLHSKAPPGFEGAYFGCEDDCAPD